MFTPQHTTTVATSFRYMREVVHGLEANIRLPHADSSESEATASFNSHDEVRKYSLAYGLTIQGLKKMGVRVYFLVKKYEKVLEVYPGFP